MLSFAGSHDHQSRSGKVQHLSWIMRAYFHLSRTAERNYTSINVAGVGFCSPHPTNRDRKASKICIPHIRSIHNSITGSPSSKAHVDIVRIASSPLLHVPSPLACIAECPALADGLRSPASWRVGCTRVDGVRRNAGKQCGGLSGRLDYCEPFLQALDSIDVSFDFGTTTKTEGMEEANRYISG